MFSVNSMSTRILYFRLLYQRTAGSDDRVVFSGRQRPPESPMSRNGDGGEVVLIRRCRSYFCASASLAAMSLTMSACVPASTMRRRSENIRPCWIMHRTHIDEYVT